MLAYGDLKSIVDSLRYKPGWELEVYETEFQGIWFAVSAEVDDSYNPGTPTDLRIKSPIPYMKDMDEFLRWIRWRLEVIEVHECHEWLRWIGINSGPIFDPHGERADEPAWPQ